MVMAGARLALNIALVITIAVEMIAAQEGLGMMVWFAWESMQTEDLYAGVAVTAFLATGINFLLKRVTNSLVPRKVERAI
jgi:NitT/TauT family transport system permease protein